MSAGTRETMAVWVRSESDPLRDVILSPPLASYGDVDLSVHNWLARPDLVAAAKEHSAYVDLLEAEGVRVHLLPGDARFPNHLYPRDAALVGPRGAWLSRFGLASRRGEEALVARALESLRVPILGATREPGTFEGGGDAFVLGRAAFVARSARTNEEGVRQVSAFLAADGVRVRVVPTTLSFHLGEPLGILDESTLLVDARWSAHPAFADFERIEVPPREAGGGNVLVLGPRKVVIHSAYAETIRRLRDAGADVIPIDLTELKKAGGGPQCLTLPVRRAAVPSKGERGKDL